MFPDSMTSSCLQSIVYRYICFANLICAKQICIQQENSRADLRRHSGKTTDGNSPASLHSTECRGLASSTLFVIEQLAGLQTAAFPITNVSNVHHLKQEMCQTRIIRTEYVSTYSVLYHLMPIVSQMDHY